MKPFAGALLSGAAEGVAAVGAQSSEGFAGAANQKDLAGGVGIGVGHAGVRA
jgi:hypothetical protein